MLFFGLGKQKEIKMRLTRKKAIELSIELWTWLAETGGYKSQWPEWERYGFVEEHCFLCEYVSREFGKPSCAHCPLYITVEGSNCFGTSFGSWCKARITGERKECAKLFLEELKALLK